MAIDTPPAAPAASTPPEGPPSSTRAPSLPRSGPGAEVSGAAAESAADALATQARARNLSRLAAIAPALDDDSVALNEVSREAYAETLPIVREVLSLLLPGEPRSTLLDVPTTPAQLPTDATGFRSLLAEPQRVFDELSDAFGWRQLDLRAKNTVESLVYVARHVALLARDLHAAEAQLLAHTATAADASRRQADELVEERDQLHAELAAVVEERDQARADLASARADLSRVKKKVNQLIDERQRIYANRQSEETLRRASEARASRLAGELTAAQATIDQLQRAASQSVGTVDDVARFWSETAGPACNREVLSFILESCRRRSAQEWSHVMLAAMPLPGHPVPVLPAMESPKKPAHTPPRELSPSDQEGERAPTEPLSPSKKPPPAEDSSEELESEGERGGFDSDEPVSEEPSSDEDEASVECEESSNTGAVAKRTAMRAGMPSSPKAGTAKRLRQDEAPPAGDEDYRAFLREAFGEDDESASEAGGATPDDSAESEVEVLEGKPTVAGPATPHTSLVLQVANPAPTPVVPALSGSQVSDVGSLLYDASWDLSRRYTILRASPQYEAALPVAFKRLVRPGSSYTLVGTDLQFSPDLTMGVSSTVPARRTEANGWRVQRPRKEPNSSGFPDYIVLREKAAEYYASMSHKLPHYMTLLESRPWDQMWLGRVRRLYLLDPALLTGEEEEWLSVICEFAFTHRQALWERNHWLAIPRKDSIYPWTPVLERRDKLAAYLDHAWRALTVTLRPNTWNRSFDPMLWQEPAFWNRADLHCTWVVNASELPDDDLSAMSKQLATIDHEEPIRIQFGGCVERFIEVLTIRNQRAFQFHHSAGRLANAGSQLDTAGYAPATLA
ncbi:hypothetical protein P43SY_009117 [Pythium insidiosum]|uniref:Uncharacterized protein n=1 Tax=Pythium insidiosum TaxID=114742 RepID=A0AAD5LA29_PYTIN|nr:hypothetical protein P43SY_009117 [Pythium insidiosum]